MANGSIWQAKDTFFTEDASGMPVRVDAGDLLREGHELVQNNPGMFQLYDGPVMRFEDVEEATAEPIPRRRGRPRKDPTPTEITQETPPYAA